MAVCWVILRGKRIYTVIQAVHSLLYIVAKCHFFSIVTWKYIIKKNNPKWKFRSLFTHPRVVPNLYECPLFCWTQRRYFEECGKQSSSGALLTSIVFNFFILWKSILLQNSLVTNFLQNIFLCVRQKQSFIQVCDYLMMSKWWQNFHFWMNYPFKHIISMINDVSDASNKNVFFHLLIIW